MMKKTQSHIYFWGGIYSQWYLQDFEEDGIVYCCSEQYMMAKKASLFNDDYHYNLIMAATEPADHKHLGRKVRNFDNEVWEQYRMSIVVNACIHKFLQNKDLLEQLLKTGDRILVEASPKDRIWGVGLHFNDPLVLDESNWNGLNLLGEALMKARAWIREEASRIRVNQGIYERKYMDFVYE